jgi:hypothetical protein
MTRWRRGKRGDGSVAAAQRTVAQTYRGVVAGEIVANTSWEGKRCDSTRLSVRESVMSWRFASAALVASASFLSMAALSPSALARDNGQFGNVPPEIRAWFKSVKSHAGIPCCDIADGHRTDYDMRDNTYWVPINGEWMKVPQEAVVDDAGNPTGDAVVWYSESNGTVYIRCFVPGGGA